MRRELVETADVVTRKRRIVSGEGTVTVRAPVTLAGERLIPGRHRFAPDHPTVRARPDLFKATDTRDNRTASELRAMVSRSRKSASGIPRYDREPGWMWVEAGDPLDASCCLNPSPTGARHGDSETRRASALPLRRRD